MLPLTPLPLQTAGERALFEELRRWDTGGAVRGAVMASIPVVDGPMERRLSDAVLFVPEGLAVVRVVEVVRQSGVVTASAEGAWTIGPEAGRPGDVLQLAGGGSSPLDGLMRAGMDAAVRLRRAGLEPGRIARLTVLVGELAGLVPADGDLGEGDQVALLEPRSLLLGIARSARYTGVDNPRLWTTADVRAALEALGLAGRGPSVQELNGEGFPYSPYVLRTPELLAPAAMAAAPRFAAPATAPAPDHSPPHAAATPWQAPARPLVDPAAAAAVAAAAIRADEEAAARAAEARDAAVAQALVSTPGPAESPPGGPKDTLVGPTVGVTADETGGIGGLFAGAEREDAPPASAAPAQPSPPPVTDPPPAVRGPLPDGVPLVAARTRPSSSRRAALLVAVALALVAVLGIGAALLFGDDETPAASGAVPSEAGNTAEPDVATGPEPGDREVVDGNTFVVEEVRVDATCVGNAYGTVADFFADTDCTGLARALYSTETGGRPVVVSVVTVDMGDTAGARALRALTDRNGSGNVSDLLREGVRYDGGPDGLSGAEYASAVSGSTVTIVETAWAAPGATGSTADLDVLASTALVLPMPESAAD
ncbi:hypothetical protein [Geodermatophilus sabuli]|uniref:Uncharacterized protein n=1 Tax=Geodermatophilus sabuli TaxID=1564158 RepID=A0A285E5Y1_9ACTN|nr:hypothetical protein [Geodermatophilus sabuli]MBB3082717.1 hypothetical protein [Geodermatophilus sabuli]SNX94417.1 hypothetical protein SAMN06893097_101210 [Geodermatophilus sabuli]